MADPVSRDVLRAVLEIRDLRHNETHAALLALFQGLAAELLDAGAVRPGPLLGRVEMAAQATANEAHGETARHMLNYVAEWLRSVQPDLPVPYREAWRAPPIAGGTSSEPEER
ncbi:MAG TPA: hypothetical protein VME92_22045 [Acetobacteraceae bacterium]|nr:hypothetical protein [Acetobacteraceae bacterium]